MGDDEENKRLAYAEYWDDRYAETEGGQLHEWFRSFKDLDEFFSRHFFEAYPHGAAPRILHLGSGDSVRVLSSLCSKHCSDMPRRQYPRIWPTKATVINFALISRPSWLRL